MCIVIDLGFALGIAKPMVGVLSALEDPVDALRAAVLSKMGERGQIRGGIIDGPVVQLFLPYLTH